MSPEVDAAFAEFVHDCGRDIYKMPTSCELFLNQYLAKFDNERELLMAGLVTGVPRHILKHPGGIGYDDHLAVIAEKFVGATGLDLPTAQWVVKAWAFAVGQPVGYAPERQAGAGRVYVDPHQPKGDEGSLKVFMASIVTAGGFLGGVLGGAMLPLVLMAVEVATEYHTRGGPMNQGFSSGVRSSAAVTVMVVVVAMVVVGGASGLGALAGWVLGRGEEHPWATFGVAFGTALATNLVVMFCLGPILGAPVQFFCVFGAVYRSAARGGGP
jgi:hypothetical protein